MKNRLLKKILGVCLAVALTAALLPGAAVPAFADGPEGYWSDHTAAVTPDGGVYTVTTPEQLAWVAAQVNGYIKFFSDSTVELNADIDLSAHYWVPIGGESPFQGDFDGNGKTISGLTIDGEMQYAGLFGKTGSGTIENVNLEGVSIEAAYSTDGYASGYVGGLVGDLSHGSLKNCSVTGSVSFSSEEFSGYCGGLVGLAEEGTIEDCFVSGSVTASLQEFNTFCGGLVGEIYSGSVSGCVSEADVGVLAGYLGGLAGYLDNTPVTDCRSTGDVDNTNGQPHTGGFVGYASAATDSGLFIEDCRAAGDVAQSADGGDVGGFIGSCSGYTVSGCSAAGAVSGGNETGGFVGHNYAAVTGSRATGSVTAGGASYIVCGGFAGYNGKAITKCYAAGDVEGKNLAGGFVGMNTHESSMASCYAAGDVSGSYNVGGFAAVNLGFVTDCYAVGDVSGDASDENRVGGFAGGNSITYIGSTPYSGTLAYCYSAGEVTTEGTCAGGFVGVNQGNESDCYWLEGTASGAAGAGGSSAVAVDDAGMSDAAFSATLNDERTPDRWITIAYVNGGYPVLVGVGDGAGETCFVTFKYGDDASRTYRVKEVPKGSAFSKPADPKMDGYTFGGWYDAPDGDEDAVEWDFETDAAAGDFTLYAHWTVKTYGVSGTVSSGFDAVSVEGLTVGLYDSEAEDYTGDPLYSAVTDADGDYSVGAVLKGDYVAAVAAGGIFAESKSTAFAAGDGVDVTAADIWINIAVQYLIVFELNFSLQQGV